MLKRALLVFVGLIVAVFVTAQFFRPELVNPPIAAGMAIEENPIFTSEIRRIIKVSCADCHSHETVYPWYSRLTPVNWWLKEHIDDGRLHLNFSTDSPNSEWEEICKEVKREKMPLPSYTWGHPGAVLSDADKKSLCDWARKIASPTELKDSGDRGRGYPGNQESGEKFDR